MNEMNAIVVIDPERALRDAGIRREIVTRMQQTNILRAGVDFGIIPGSSKPSLLKPGAERLCSAMGFNPHFRLVNKVERWEPESPLFHYQYECALIHIETGREIATGIGSCNSMEAKYRWRKAERVCPVCAQATIIKGKQEYGGGWLCFAKKGGCGAKFADDDHRITEQQTGNVPNDDIFSLINTIDKMAQKRALIAATLIGANASEFFTQDIEDMPGFGGDVVEGSYTVVAEPEKTNGTTKTKPGKAGGVATFPTEQDWQTFSARMAKKYATWKLASVPELFGVDRVSDIRGTIQEAEATVEKWADAQLPA